MMRRARKVRLGLVGAVLILVILGSAAALAQAPEQNYDLSWYTVDSGGYTWSTGGTYTLGGTAGQPDAGLLAGGDYALGGGFWTGGALGGFLYRIYLPLVARE